MEYVVQILIVFVIAGCLLKLSFLKFWQACLFGALCAAFVILSRRWAIMQSKTQLADWLDNVRIMQDAAVLITVESALFFAFCFVELRATFDGAKRRWWRPLLKWYPGLLVFPALFYLQTQLIFALPGSDFAATSWVLAIGVAVLVPSLSYGARRLCLERELRLEVLFLASVFVCLIGLVATVNGNVTYAPVKGATNLKAVALAAGAFLALFGAGLTWNKLKWNRKNGNHL